MNRSALNVVKNHLACIMSPDNKQVPWWRGIHIIALAGLGLRITLAFVSDNIYHPDEIFQYLEQGHRIAFGYGIIPWEYRFGIRSYIIPGFISGLLYLCKLLQIDDPAIYTIFIKAVCCLLSISLIYSVYIIGRNLASEAAGRMASVFACSWYELIYFAHKPSPEVLSMYLLMGASALAVSRPDNRRPMLFGLLSGLSVALRLQYLPIIVFIGIVICLAWRKDELVKSGLIFLVVLGMSGGLDYLTWGQMFSSYYENYLFNGVYKVSELFGTSPAYFYLYAIAIVSLGIFCLMLLSSFFLLPITWLPVACVFINILSHSMLSHKEYRFILVSIPLLLILTAVVATAGILKYTAFSRQSYFSSLAVGIMILISVAGLFGKLPFQGIIYPQAILSKQDMLTAYTFLYQDPSLVAVLNLKKGWEKTGGYYYLHRDIPIYYPYHLRAKHISSDEIGRYVSHIICPGGMPDIQGFTALARIGNIEIRRQINPPNRYMMIDVDTRDVYQRGIDKRYVPTVKRCI